VQGQIGDQVGEYVTIFKPGQIKASRTVNLHFSGYAMSADQMAFDTNGDLSQVNLNVGNLDGPGLAVDRAGNVYVSGFYNGHIDVFAPGSINPTRVINQGAQDMQIMPDGTLYASNGDGVDEYAPGGSTPVNVINAYDDQGYGVAVGPAN
jgi:hypothetical protein